MSNIKYIKKLFGDLIIKSGVIYTGETELKNNEEGIYNYLNFQP